ncbi:MAG: TetR/AcrR family transcriptional regulator [Microthrixaceae bacterium]
MSGANHTTSASGAAPIHGETATLPPGLELGDTARRILCAAVELFATRGFHGTSMRELADASGLRAPSIYEHFGSKEQLLVELIAIGRDVAIVGLDHAAADAEPTPPERLDAAVTTLVAIHTTWPALMRVLTDDVHGVGERTVHTAAAARLELSLRLGQILAEGETSGDFDVGNLVATVAAVHGLLIRIPHWFTPGEDYGVDDLTRDYRRLVRAMLHVR